MGKCKAYKNREEDRQEQTAKETTGTDRDNTDKEHTARRKQEKQKGQRQGKLLEMKTYKDRMKEGRKAHRQFYSLLGR